MKTTYFIWLLRLTSGIILLQTLFFKFTASEESVYIFSTLGMESFGRIASGIMELIVAILILTPRTTLLGALLAMAILLGAIFAHIFVLGIEVKNDGGLLFILAIITFLCCSVLVYKNKDKIPGLIKFKI